MDCIRNWWQVCIDGCAMFRVAKQLDFVKINLKKWNRESFGHIFYSKNSIIQQMNYVQEEIQSKGLSEEIQLQEDFLLAQLHDIVAKEEDFQRQRSHAICLKSRDHNSKFFHLTALRRKSSNKISSVMVDGLLLADEDAIRRVAANYFEQMLSDDLVWDQQSVEDSLDVIPQLVSEHLNRELTTIPSSSKIKEAIFSFEGNKAPGPDGFPFLFFQSCQEIVAEDVINSTKEFFGSRRLLRELNVTFIVLIPKTVDANGFGDYHPISLCNSIYNILLKVLATRLQKILPNLISKQQVALLRVNRFWTPL